MIRFNKIIQLIMSDILCQYLLIICDYKKKKYAFFYLKFDIYYKTYIHKIIR